MFRNCLAGNPVNFLETFTNLYVRFAAPQKIGNVKIYKDLLKRFRGHTPIRKILSKITYNFLDIYYIHF